MMMLEVDPFAPMDGAALLGPTPDQIREWV